MTLRMADGPVANLPPGLDAYAGYVNRSGIGITYPEVVAEFPNAQHLSITTNRNPAAMCADVEKGTPPTWAGFTYGYCAVSNVNDLINTIGRPQKLWTAHHNNIPHICSPVCWPGLVTTADGTQWTDHGGLWDESLLDDNFFDLAPPPPPEGIDVQAILNTKGEVVIVGTQQSNGHTVVVTQGADGKVSGGWSLADVTGSIEAAYPGTVVVVE